MCVKEPENGTDLPISLAPAIELSMQSHGHEMRYLSRLRLFAPNFHPTIQALHHKGAQAKDGSGRQRFIERTLGSSVRLGLLSEIGNRLGA